MGAIVYFDESNNGKVRGSSSGEPDGTEHIVNLLEGNGHMILRVELSGFTESVDLLFTDEQAAAFAEAAEDVLLRIGPPASGGEERHGVSK